MAGSSDCVSFLADMHYQLQYLHSDLQLRCMHTLVAHAASEASSLAAMSRFTLEHRHYGAALALQFSFINPFGCDHLKKQK
jgi:hypothetical protein